jgi:(hydroxyamino)benzene mutase
MTSIVQQLMVWGAVLFLLGLLIGFAVPALRNPRMGVSVHLTGVQGAMMLWIFGLLWPHLGLSAGVQAATAVLAVLGIYSNWAGLLLSALWGTSRATPIAGAGHQASRSREGVVTALLASGSIELVLAALAVLWGLLRMQ